MVFWVQDMVDERGEVYVGGEEVGVELSRVNGRARRVWKREGKKARVRPRKINKN